MNLMLYFPAGYMAGSGPHPVIYAPDGEFQFMLIVMSIIALVRVYGGSAGPQAVHPTWSWFSPFGLSASELAAGVILCIFTYWGWNSCLAVTDETRTPTRHRVGRP